MLVAGIIIAAIVILVLIVVVIAVVVKFGGGNATETKSATYYDHRALSRFKGEIGENIVARILGNTVAGEQYVINNITFADRQGRSCQIDHIYINRHGIWVIETKNYSWRIYGCDGWREWTQILAYGHERHKLYNPVKQNATHIYMLSKQLRERKVFQNLVVFLADADIANVNSSCVCGIGDLKRRINSDTGTVLSPAQMDGYYKRLSALKENSAISETEHVRNIEVLQNSIRLGICPRCGADLVLRNGNNGKFYGCAKYPKCNFTKNL